jgi:hypothetical protein
MYLKSDGYSFPDERYEALPAMILRWILREARLLKGKNNRISERYFYFYPNKNNFVKMRLLDDDILALELISRRIKESSILHTVFSREGRMKTKIIYVNYDDYFRTTYLLAESFYNRLRNQYPQGGDMFVLSEELNLSKKIINRINKGI